MSELMRLDEEYRNWIQDLGNRYKTSQIKASIRVNNEMLMYYWSVAAGRILQRDMLTVNGEINFFKT